MEKTILQPPPRIIVVDLFPEILDELLELLAGLAAKEWGKPTVCPGRLPHLKAPL